MNIMNKVLLRSGAMVDVESISDIFENGGAGLMSTNNSSNENGIDMMIAVNFKKLFIWMIYPLPMNGLDNPNNIGFVDAESINEASDLIYRHITPIDPSGCLARITVIEKNFEDDSKSIYNVECPPDIALEIYDRWRNEEEAKRPKLYSWICEGTNTGTPDSNTLICHGIVNAISETEATLEVIAHLPYGSGCNKNQIHLELIDPTKPFDCFSYGYRSPASLKLFEWTVNNPPLGPEYNLKNDNPRLERGQESGVATAKNREEVMDLIRGLYPNIDKAGRKCIINIEEINETELTESKIHMIGSYTE